MVISRPRSAVRKLFCEIILPMLGHVVDLSPVAYPAHRRRFCVSVAVGTSAKVCCMQHAPSFPNANVHMSASPKHAITDKVLSAAAHKRSPDSLIRVRARLAILICHSPLCSVCRYSRLSRGDVFGPKGPIAVRKGEISDGVHPSSD